MAAKSVYFPHAEPRDGRLQITGDEHHHLSVASAEEGETVEVLDGRGGVWTCAVVSASRKETVLRILETRRHEKSGPEVFLALSFIKPSAFELALEKAVEVGVTRIIPFTAARSNTTAGRRGDRWKSHRDRSGEAV